MGGYSMRWKGNYLWRMILDLRTVQRPLKKKYRDEPGSSRITLEARASQQDTPIACSVDVGQAIYEACAYDAASGQMRAATFMDYAMPRADNLPSISFGANPQPATTNPLGIKGCGEAGTAGSLGATPCAGLDALARLRSAHASPTA